MAETHGSQAILRKAQAQEAAPHRAGALQPELLVVLRGAAVVAVAFDYDNQVWKLVKNSLQVNGYMRQFALLRSRKGVRVEIEVQIRRYCRHPVRHPTWRRFQPA